MPILLGKLLPKDHITLTSAHGMLEISAEMLQRYHLIAFSHTRLYNDSSRFTLTTDPSWFSHFINKGYFNYTRLDRHAACYQDGYFLWDAWNKNCPSYQIVVKDAEENFNGGRGISIIKKSAEWVDKYEFSSETRNYGINQFYLSNIDLLENLVSLYKEKAAKLIEAAHHHRNFLPYEVDISSEYIDTMLPTNILSAVSNDRMAIRDNSFPVLTRRELECISWLIKGKTLPEIAIILARSPRTLEKYILSIKEKLGCYTFFQIGQKISELGLSKLLGNVEVCGRK